MKLRTTILTAIVCAALFATGLRAHAACAGCGEEDKQEKEKSPTEIVKKATQDVLDILRDPELEGEENEQKRREMLRDAVSEMFNWRAMARSSLGQHWRDRTDAEKKEFTRLFRKLLETTYLKRIRRNADADLRYVGEEIDGDYATVSTVAITRNGTEAPIKYYMKKVEEEESEGNPELPAWQVYNVSVEGVSLVNNYRAQFRDILIGSSYEELVRKLRAKVERDK